VQQEKGLAEAPPLAARPVPWNGRGRRLVEPTEWCYSEGDSRDCHGIVTPASLGYPLSVFNKNVFSQTIRYSGDSHENPNVLWGLVDADWARDIDTRQAHTGYILMMNCGPISWKSHPPDNMSLSTSQAKFIAANQAGQEAIYLRETLTSFGFSQTKAILLTLLYEDNLACVAISENPVRRKFCCLIDIREYYVCELVPAEFSNSCLCARTKWCLTPSRRACRPLRSSGTVGK